MKLLSSLCKLIRNIHYRKQNIFLSLSAITDSCTFEENTLIHDDCVLVNCIIGKGTYIGERCCFKNTAIGRFCSIATDVKLISGNHPTSKYVSTHPAMYSNITVAGLNFNHHTEFNEYSLNSDKRYLTIGNDVWIASNVLIIGGCKIGDGAIIAAGSVVTKDVPPYTIVGGVPAKFIKYRFEKEQIDALLQFKWWEKGIDWINNNIELFDDIETFVEVVKQNNINLDEEVQND